MLINLSNHPYSLWDEKQRIAAQPYGEVVDLTFPQVDAYNNEIQVAELCKQYIAEIDKLATDKAVTVHIMGEMTFCFRLISELISRGIHCIASTSERDVMEIESGQKQVNFNFVRFRKYNL